MNQEPGTEEPVSKQGKQESNFNCYTKIQGALEVCNLDFLWFLASWFPGSSFQSSPVLVIKLNSHPRQKY